MCGSYRPLHPFGAVLELEARPGLQDDHVVAGAGETVCDQRTRGPGPDDTDVDAVGGGPIRLHSE
jgi:hypothetical protein